jgi:hypothetical protein
VKMRSTEARKHRHRAVDRSREVGWTRCVWDILLIANSLNSVDIEGEGPNSADAIHCVRAHGGVIFAEYCRCGATRLVEVNGLHRATTPWWKTSWALGAVWRR